MQIDLEPSEWESAANPPPPRWHRWVLIAFYVGAGIPLSYAVTGVLRYILEAFLSWL